MKKLTLTHRFHDEVDIGGQRYPLDLSFDNVLRVFELFTDEDFSPVERILTAFEMFVDEELELPFEVVDRAVYEIFKESLNIDLADQQDPNVDTKKYFDLYEDAERIYAAFIREYGMDLFLYHGKLHFQQFSALLNQVVDRSFKEVVTIRAQDLPSPTKHNAEERKHLSKLKRLYRLRGTNEDPEVVAENVDSAWDKLANFFRPGR